MEAPRKAAKLNSGPVTALRHHRDRHHLEAMQRAGGNRGGMAGKAQRKEDQHTGRWQRKSGPCGQSTAVTVTQQP